MPIQSNSKKPIQSTFLFDLAPETLSAICSHLKMFDFYRFQSSSKQYQKSEPYNGSNYAGLQSEFDFLLYAKCPNAGEILANVIKRGGAVKMDIKGELYGTWRLRSMISRSYFQLFETLRVRNWIVNDKRNALLAFSAYRGKVEFCKLFLDLGANVNHVDNDGYSVLSSDCSGGDLSVVKLIVTSGANVNFLTGGGNNALFIAMSDPDKNYRIPIANFLLDSGADHTLASRYGYTCLHYSVDLCNFDLYKRLLDMGVNSSLRHNGGKTAIDLLVDLEHDGYFGNYGIDSVRMIMSLLKWYKQLSRKDLLLN